MREEKHNEQSLDSNSVVLRFGKQIFLTFIFATTVIFICFVGQDPPSLRTLGEVAPENVYADRDFKYLSDVRRAEAEEWIRSSTPREFAQDFVGEESFSKALIRLKDGLLALESLPDEIQEQAALSLIDELESNFKLKVVADELGWLRQWRNFPKGQDLFLKYLKFCESCILEESLNILPPIKSLCQRPMLVVRSVLKCLK